MADLTVIFITASNQPEEWTKFHRKVLEEAIKDFPLITVSRKPLRWGINLLDEEKKSLSNIYFQILRAAKLAKTPYIAIAEDDTLYPREHFTFYRPPLDTFLYNQNRLALFTWEPIYSWRNRKSNCSLIAPRELLIEALEERFKKWPQGTPDKLSGEVGRGTIERGLGITERKSMEKFSTVSLIQFNHENASEERQVRHRKSLGNIRALDIPHWGPAKELVKNYK